MATQGNKPPQDLSCYRLNDVDELFGLYENYGPEEASAIKEKLFRSLTRLERGRSYRLGNLPDEKKELVVKLCCLWILRHPEYELSNDYTKIRRL